MTSAIFDFEIIRPKHSRKQREVVEWIAEAHAYAEAQKRGWNLTGKDYQTFHQELKKEVEKLGLGSGKIETRGIQSSDFLHTKWEKMEVFNLNKWEQGAGIHIRKAFFEREIFDIFEQFFPNEKAFSPHLIHVSCTGYAAPSGAQRIVSKLNQGHRTAVTHAYHMGCYAAFPALRMGIGFKEADIVHTEMCSLHFNPLLHTPEQLVVQTLFADGFIKYSLGSILDTEKRKTPHLKILALHEEIIPETIESMSWLFEEWGMKMTVAKEVPVLIKRNLNRFVSALSKKAERSSFKNVFFAIHPGGPKIVQQIQEILSLEETQIEHSQEILACCGNMSSATLPHIWEKMLKDPKIPKGATIIALAFGPGLTISGGVFEKWMY